jgi:hypothetical protein
VAGEKGFAASERHRYTLHLLAGTRKRKTPDEDPAQSRAIEEENGRIKPFLFSESHLLGETLPDAAL